MRLCLCFVVATAVLIGCHQSTEPRSDREDVSTPSAQETSRADRNEERRIDLLRKTLTERGWAHNSGGFGSRESWSFHFLANGTYTFTLYSDYQPEPVVGKWSLVELPGDVVSLRLRDLERGKYDIIDQDSYPQYDAATDTMMFPSQPGGRGYLFHPWEIKGESR
ncbi:MAG: hypothetical protein AAGG48_31020 [Planctomycetota bacterium]